MEQDIRDLSDGELTKHFASKLSIRGFLVVNKFEANETMWGEYYLNFKTIVIYSKYMTLTRFYLTILHEIAHYICYELYQYKGHGKKYKEVLAIISHLYFDGEVPKKFVDLLKEDGLYYEFESTEKRGKSQLNLWGAWEMAKAKC